MLFGLFTGKSNEISDAKDAESLDISGEMHTMLNTTIINATTNTGKPLQLPIATVKNLTPIVTNTKRHSMILTSSSPQTEFKKSSPTKCQCSSAHAMKKPQNNHTTCIRNESFSCESISKSFISTDIETPKLLSTNPIPTPVTPIISLSKSETNIAVANVEDNRNQLAIFNVVSLNNLHENDMFFDRTLNDVPKNQYLVSDNELHELSPKKHNVTLSSPKVLTTVTVSMRNTIDVSDKIF